MQEVKAPNKPYGGTDDWLFLAGSIDMGNAVDWQKQVVDALKDTELTIFNPRRDDWDSTWVQDITNPQFREQVERELRFLTSSNHVIVVFDPAGKAPITLMELGLVASNTDNHNIYVVCPKGYWRRGNVQVLCNKYKIPLYEEIDDMLKDFKESLEHGRE